jgi:hypothetical protein
MWRALGQLARSSTPEAERFLNRPQAAVDLSTANLEGVNLPDGTIRE